MTKIIGAGGGGCFTGGTYVRTPDGACLIEKLKEGDKVVSFDDKGVLHEALILKVHKHEEEQVYKYNFWGGASFTATSNHWVLNQFNAFVAISNLGPDDCVVDVNNHLLPIVGQEDKGISTVYNLTVEGQHTFIADNIRVHNAGLGQGVGGTRKIIGAGGGGGKGGGSRTPTTAPDSLDSKSYAKVVDLLSEGEIEGLTDGLKSVYLNNTPIQNSDGTDNFENVSFVPRTGTDPQTLIPGFGATATTIAVNREVTKGSPNNGETETVFSGASSAANAPDAIRVVLKIPALQNIEDDGDIVGTSVRIKIYWEIDGSGTWVEKIDDIITGRTGDLYKKDYLINTPSSWSTGIKIRMTRETDNSGDVTRLSNQTWFDTYIRLVYANNTYPNSALVGLRIDAEQFSSIPKRAYRIKGVKVRLPSNASVNATSGRVTYSGVWNGTFGAAQWCSDPCWCLWDMLTSQRYGLGDHLLTKAEKASFNGDASKLDKWAFYSASQYANELVSDGFGGTEPRFSCNVSIRGKAEAFNVINAMASVFRAMPYWSAGSLTVTQDKLQDSSYLFNLSNVAPEGFSYSGSSQKTRCTVAVVKYFDMTLRTYAYEEVKDTAAINKYGAITKNLEAFACTSRGQAQRVGKWLLYSEGNEVETVTFKTSIDAGCVVRPGQVIDIADPTKAGVRRGGRIKSATTTTITVDGTDADTDLPVDAVGYTRTLHIVSPTGTVETRPVSSIVKHTGFSEITAQTAFDAAPNANSVWILETTGGTSAQNIQTTQWRIVSVEEVEELEYQVVALAYNSSKYANIESGIALTFRDFSNLNEIPSAPTGLRMSQVLYKKGDQVRVKVLFSWNAVLGVNRYEVRWRRDFGNWNTHIQQGPDDEILNITPGTFNFKIYSLNAQGVPCNTPLTGAFTAEGKTAAPSDVTGFINVVDPHLGVILKWNKLVATRETGFKDLDVVNYEIRTDLNGAEPTNWSLDDANHSTNLIARLNANRFKVGTITTGTTNFYIKAIDSEGNYSVNHASQAITVGTPTAPSPSATLEGGYYFMTWEPVSTTGKYTIDFYEVYENGTGSSNLLDRTDTTRFHSVVTWQGDRDFFVKAVDIAGNSSTAAQITITNTPAIAPTITHTFEDDAVKLSWSEVSGSIPTRAYVVKKGTTSQSFAEASEIGRVKGDKFALAVNWTDTQRFWIAAVDENGTFGTAGSRDVAFTSATIDSITDSFVGENLVLTWTSTKGALAIGEYELRMGDTTGSTSTWGGAISLGRVDGTTFTRKVDWGGTKRFWIAGVDVQGNIGTEVLEAVVVSVPNEVPDFRQEVIDNNVLLRWGDAKNTLPIVYYNIKKGSSWGSGISIGTKQGLFTTVFETTSGTFTYRIRGVDSAGNEGDESTVTASVNQPPDYILRSNIDDDFSGTKTNVFSDVTTDFLYANVNTTQTWEDHFDDMSWNSPQDQVTAGYTIYGLPSETSGSYVEEVDYGTVLAGTKIVMALTGEHVIGTTGITPKIYVKTASGDSWGSPFTGSQSTSSNLVFSAFATNFRFVKYELGFSSTGNDDLLKMTALNLRLETKQIGDSGRGTASASDTGGTTVTFNVSFVDVESITVTPSGTTARIGIYDFVDAPNPTTFKVLLYDTSGNRASGDFSWQARGS